MTVFHLLCVTNNFNKSLPSGFTTKTQLEDPCIDGRIILKSIFKKWDGAWTGLIWLRIGTGDGLL
jgi:hypothetical protein